MISNLPLFIKNSNQVQRGLIHWLVLMALIMATLMSSLFIIFPTHAAGVTSNLVNRYIHIRDVFPGRLYRGDARAPDNIFANGFISRGTNYDLILHVDESDVNGNGYISTSSSRQIANAYAKDNEYTNLNNIAQKPACSTTEEAFYAFIPVIGQFFLGQCAHSSRTVSATTYVYEIDPAYAQNAFYVPTNLQANEGLYNAYDSEKEWAYVYKIPTQAIVGVHVYLSSASLNNNGRINSSSIAFKDEQRFVANPNYGGTTHTNPNYQPGSDSGSGWRYSTDPNLPTTSCPANPTTYEHCS